jgi:PAS domain S-box-containing protein
MRKISNPRTEPVHARKPTRFTFELFVGAALLLVSILGLVGWLFGIMPLVSVIPGAVTMKVNAALALFFSGVALLLVRRGRGLGWLVGRACALVPGIIGLLTLFEHATGWNIGIDELLFLETGTLVGTLHPGRMSPNCAAIVLLSAAALWLMSRPVGQARRPLILGWLGSLVIAISLLGLLGYLVGFNISPTLWRLTALAIHTAVLYLLLGIAVSVFAWREAERRWLIGPWLTTMGVGALVLFVMVAAFSYRSTTDLFKSAKDERSTRKTLDAVYSLTSELEKAQSGTRGFVITGEGSFLNERKRANANLLKDLRRLRALIEGRPDLQARLAVIAPLITERIEFSQEAIDQRTRSGFESARVQIATSRGKQLSYQIRTQLTELAQEVERVLVSDHALVEEKSKLTLSILPLGMLLSLGLFTAVLFKLNAEITASRNVESALRESETRFRSVADNSPVLIWEAGLDKGCNYFNKCWLDFTGRTMAMELGNGWTEGVHPEDFDRCLEVYVGSFDRREKFRMEYRLRRADGQFRLLIDTGVPRYSAAGEFIGYIGSCIDITEIKQVQLEVLKLNAELEQRVAERTEALQTANTNILLLNSDLETRAIKLELVNKELEAFSYSVSHDLRAPVRAIGGYAHMMIEDCAPEMDANGRRLLQVICDEAMRMSHLIDDLLSFSRISRQQTEPVAVDMRSMAQEAYDELIAAEPDRTVEFDLQELPPTIGTPAMIRQVWINLIGNALKFTRKCPKAIIEIGAQKDADGNWVYHIKDNGAGFDMRHANKLFGVFQRLHTQPEFEGTGVGLALVQRILERHGGRIWAEAEVDQGACFFFTLPDTTPVAVGLPKRA